MGLRTPVILVGNKTDLREGISEELEGYVRPIMEAHRQLDVCIECSAKEAFNIAEVFYFAQKAVLHPTAPLYDVSKHSLKPRAEAALKRIFKLCDMDHDGKLNDEELNRFQYNCFGVELKEDELSGVKNVVKESCPFGLDKDGALNLRGFLFLHTLFIQKGRLETTWTVIRKYGYEDDMTLRGDYVDTTVKKNEDQVIELSDAGRSFLLSAFEIADQDNDGFLSPEEQDLLFQSCPDNPWKLHARWVPSPPSNPGYLSKDAFLARWIISLLDDSSSALMTLVYIGYPDPPSTAITVSKSRRRDRRSREVTRNVFRCYVLGSPKSGKTELVRGLVGHPFGSKACPPGKTLASASELSYEGHPKTLVLLEIPESRLTQWLTSKEFQSAGDLVVLVYDVSDRESFEYASRLFNTIESSRKNVPCVFVGTKADLPPAPSVGVHATEICTSHGLPEPVLVSMQAKEDQNIYQMLVEVAMNPQVACPDYFEVDSTSDLSTYMLYGAGTILIGGLLYLGWRSWSKRGSSTSGYMKR
eukprot:CAMPEP_0184680684 /NCGR_PEP_ID=MMETSP0312-20130426/3577_1 /TAXON_ID=31354 /ORGANISM="Compsopogon coeruleus, Strain SAG 36.94" /LENGTH=528 /DNA_ID=CAMNT_0027130963 /DNA_START=577 /DNA_END=2163 /DNA_ORIENTATION=+